MIDLVITTPEGTMYESTDVVSVSVPTDVAFLTIYPEHQPLVSLLLTGEITIEKQDHEVEMVISSGILQVERHNDKTRVRLLVESADRIDEIDVDAAMAAKERAEKYLSDQQEIEDEEFAKIQAQIEKEIAKIDAGTRYLRSKRRN